MTADHPTARLDTSLSDALRQGRVSSLQEGVQNLPASQRKAIRSTIGLGAIAELNSLSQTSVDKIFYRNLIRFGGRLENRGHYPQASILYSALTQAIPSEYPDIAGRAEERWGMWSFGKPFS